MVTSPTADPEVMSLIPTRSHTFVEIDHKIISAAVHLLPLIQEGLSYVHKVLVYCLVKLAPKKVWLGELTTLT